MSPAHGRGLRSLVTRPWPLATALASPVRGFWLAAALLTAALLCAAEPAGAHSTSNFHVDMRVDLSPSTLTPGETTTVTFRCTAHCSNLIPFASSHQNFYVEFSITSLDGVSLSTNRRITFDTPGGSKRWSNNPPSSTGLVTISASSTATAGSVTVSASVPYSPGDWWYGTYDEAPRLQSATLQVVTPAIVLSESTLAVDEGTTATYTVKLATQPTSGVQVHVARGAANYVLNKAGGTQGVNQNLTFTTTTWNTAQVITVIALDDSNAIAGTSNISHTTVDANTAAEYDSVSKNLPLTVADDDAAIVVSRGTGALALDEETAETYTVTLKGQPAGNVVVQVTSDDVGAVTVGPGTLTFTTSTWNTGQTVTASAVVDADVTDETVTVTHTVVDASSSNEFDPADDVTFMVNVTDTTRGLAVSGVTGQATEAGGTAAFTVALKSQPTAAATVAVASQDPGEGIAAPGQLAFSTTTWETEQTVTVTGQDDNADDGDVSWNVRLATSSGDTNYNTLPAEDVAVTTTDDDGPPGVTLALSAASLTESGAGSTATVSATLAHPSGAATTVTVTPVAELYTVGAGAAATILIAAGAMAAPTDGATIIATANTTDEPDRTGTVTATVGNARAAADSTTMMVTGAALTVRDDDPAPDATLTLNPTSIAENGGLATVTATLDRPSSAPTTVTVTPVAGAYTVGTGADAIIVIAAGATATATDIATVTGVDDPIDQGAAASTYRTAMVTATLTNTQGAGAVTGATLTLTDDDPSPTVTLALMPASIAENGGVATVTATLSGLSSQAVTLTVATTAGTGAVAADFTQSGTTLLIAAGATTSTGAVTVTAVDNVAQTGSKQVTVAGTATGGHGVTAPPAATLTITDDDTAQATLRLTPTTAMIAENGGVATVTATLNRPSSLVVTVTVSAAAGTGAVAADFTLSPAPRLTFAATTTTSSGVVTITATDNETDAPNKSVTVSGVAADSAGLTNSPPAVTLTITDDDPAPDATLTLNPTSIAENGGVATVTATLDRPSSDPTTVTVTPVAGAYTVGAGAAATIVIAAGDTANATDVATITGVDDAIDQGTAASTYRTAMVTATLTNPHGTGAVTGVTLTLTDDETLPTVTLAVTPTSVTEAGGPAQVTATLSGASSQAVTLTVGTTAVSPAVATDFTRTGTTLLIPAGTTASTGTVTVRGNDNPVDAPDKAVTVSATATGGHSVANPAAVTLTLTDDEATPTATLVLTPPAILENEDVSTVTARLSHPTTEATTMTVATTAVSPAVPADFTRTGSTLIVAAGATTSTGTVTVTAVDNPDPSGRKQVAVAATAAGGRGVADPAQATLTIRDDEFGLDESTVTGPATEAGGTATFTVALQTEPTAAVTVAVTSLDASEGTVSPSALVFTTSTWETAQTVTVTGVDDAVDDGDVDWQVRLDPSSSDVNYNGLPNVDVPVTTEDDDDAPTVTLVLTPAVVPEAGGVSTVTATLSHPSIAATTVTVSAPADDVMLNPPATLVIPAAQTTSTGLVTFTARDNAVDAPDKTVTVAGTATNARASIDGMTVTVTPATLTLTDDDERGMAFDPAALVVAAGSTAAYTVALTSEPTGSVTVTLTPDAAVTVDPATLTFTATSWNAAQPVTLTVAADTTAPASLVEHQVTGGDYQIEMKALPVTRMTVSTIEPTEPIETTGEAGVHHYIRDDQLVTVMTPESEAVPAGVRFTPATSLTRPLTVTVRLLTEDEADMAAGSEFRLGLPTERVALDVRVLPPQPGRLCLPVSDELWDRAADRDSARPLVLVRAGETVPGSAEERGLDAAGRTRVLRVCADVPAFSPFAVGYTANEQLAFPADQQGQTFTFYTGRAVTEKDGTLPKPGGGEPLLTYNNPEPALPAGLKYNEPKAGDEHGGTITGTPTTPMKQDYTLTVTDVYDADVLTFTIEVKPGIESRDLALVLAGIGRTLASDAVEILGSRVGPAPSRLHVTLGGQVLRLTDPAESGPAASPSASRSPSPLAGEGRGEGAAAPAATSGPSPWQRVTGVALGVARALGVTLDTPALSSAPVGAGQSEGSTFQRAQPLLYRTPADSRRTSSPTWRSPLSIQPVAAKDLLARSAFELPLTRTGDDGVPAWTLWGRGAASGFSGQPEDGFKMDGTLYSGYVGLDYRPRSSLLMGLAVAHSTGTVDYERTGGTTAGVDVNLTSLLPYAHWQPTAGLGVWGLLGAGWGDMDLKAAGDPRTYTTALTSWLGAIGGRQALTTWQGIDLAAKTDAFLTTVRSEAKMDLPGARGHAERVRLLMEGQTAVDLSPVSRMQPRLEVGGRWDSGTAEQGLGLELGGGLAYTQTEWGLSVDMQGRYLLVHEDGAFEDWGASMNVRLDPGVGGEGAYLTVAPVWGQPGSGVEQLWGNAAAVPGGTTPARPAGWRPANVEIDVGYGLALADGRGLLTPYGGLALGNPGTARYRLGSRWAVSALLDLSIEGERAEQPWQAVAHSVSVRLGWQW